MLFWRFPQGEIGENWVLTLDPAFGSVTPDSKHRTKGSTVDLYSTVRLGNHLLNRHGLYDWSFGTNDNKRRVGVCFQSDRRIEVSRIFLKGMSEREVAMVILHEIAHALVGPGQAHGPVWRQKCLSIGGDGKVQQDSISAPADSYKYAIQCPVTGQELGRMHRKSARMSNHAACKCHRQRIKWVTLR